MKYLFIDRNEKYLKSLAFIFENNHNVILQKCQSTESVFCALAKHEPDVLFIDDDLAGCLGFIHRDIDIYLNTTNDKPKQYERMDCIIYKFNFGRIEEIIAQAEEKEKEK